MSADATVDLIINQKSSFQVTFTVKDNGSVLDLTGYTATAKYKQTHQAPDNQSVSITAAIANAVSGHVSISLSANETSLLQAGKYVYDVAIIDSTGFKTRIVEGNMRVSPGVA
jgi:BppU N-terminal domain